MKRKPLKRFAATLACTLLAVLVWLAANNEKHDADHHPDYKLIEGKAKAI